MSRDNVIPFPVGLTRQGSARYNDRPASQINVMTKALRAQREMADEGISVPLEDCIRWAKETIECA